MLGLTSDMFSGLTYQLLVVSPAISWILKPGRFSRRQGFLYAVAFLVLLAALSIATQMSEQASNFYHVVGVHRDASLTDIKRAYRLRSMDLHPDKNPSPEAAAEFSRLRLAFDVLGDAAKRPLYDLYGEDAVEKNQNALVVETIIKAISYYGVWAVFTYVLTLSDAARDARAWSYAGIVLLLITEVNLQFADLTLPVAVFPFMTVYEFTRLLRAAFPLFMNGTRALSGYYYQDLAIENLRVGMELLRSNQAIQLSLRELQGEVASSRRRPESGKVVQDDTLPAAARKRMKHDKRAPATKPTPTIAEDVPTTNPELDALQNPSPAVQAAPSAGIPRFVYMIALYFAFNYFFGSK